MTAYEWKPPTLYVLDFTFSPRPIEEHLTRQDLRVCSCKQRERESKEKNRRFALRGRIRGYVFRES